MRNRSLAVGDGVGIASFELDFTHPEAVPKSPSVAPEALAGAAKDPMTDDGDGAMPMWVGLARFLIRTKMAQALPSIRRLLGPGVDYLKYYNRRILGSPNVELKATQALLDRRCDDVIDLSLGAPEFDTGRLALPCVADERHSGYPGVSGLPILRRAIADKLARDNAIHVDAEGEVLVTNGVSQGIGLMLDTFVDAGDRVVLFDPCFFMYRLAAMNRGAKVVPLATWMEDGKTCFAENHLRRALRQAKVVFVNSPSNPTGGVLTRDALDRIAYYCAKYDVLIFSDEVYERFQYQDEPCSIASLRAAAGRTLTANSFSKSHALASFRIGYLAGPRYLVQPMIVSALATCPFVSMTAQQMALAALAEPRQRFTSIQARFARRRQAVSAALWDAQLFHEMPAGAFYFWIPIRHLGLTGAEFAHQLLEQERVLVMPGDACGASGRHYIRLSYSLAGRGLIEGLRRLRRFVDRLQPSILPLGTGGKIPPAQKRSA